MAGKPVHFEIPAQDTGKATDFWGSLFGWQFQAFEGSPSSVSHDAVRRPDGRRDLRA